MKQSEAKRKLFQQMGKAIKPPTRLAKENEYRKAKGLPPIPDWEEEGKRYINKFKGNKL